MWSASFITSRIPLNLRAAQRTFVQPVRNKRYSPWPSFKTRWYRGVFFIDGMQCHKDDVLVRTWKFNYYPGLNVTFRQELDYKVLRAVCDGTVMMTTEKIDPDFAFKDIQELYNWRKEVVEGGTTKLTVNVIPFEQHGRFRLKDTVT